MRNFSMVSFCIESYIGHNIYKIPRISRNFYLIPAYMHTIFVHYRIYFPHETTFIVFQYPDQASISFLISHVLYLRNFLKFYLNIKKMHN